MPLDTKDDVVITSTGACVTCGRPKGKDTPGKYCGKCMTEALKTPEGAADYEEDPSQAAARVLAERELCRRRLLPYVKMLIPTYQAGWFHKDLAARLERFARRVEAGESPRLIINVPPRHGKSEQASKAFVSWFLGRNPSKQIIAATHSEKLALDNSRDVLNNMKDRGHQKVFPDVSLSKEQKGATGWRTGQSGSYKPVGVGAGIAGYGADILIIDDPHKDTEAYSPTVRESVWRWYKSSATTRLMPGAGIILIQTRWTMDDLTGRVIDEEGKLEEGGDWEVVSYPAEAVEDEYRLPNGRIVHEATERAVLLRKKDEMLHPERWPERLLRKHKKDPVIWQALYQQNPIAGEAAQFTEEMFPFCTTRDIPERLTYYSTWDTALGLKNQNDYSVHILFAVDEDDNIWIIHVDRDRWDSEEIVERIIDSFFERGQDAIGIEKTHQYMAIEPFLEKRITEREAYGLYVHPLDHGNKDKVSRARPIQARSKQGKVMIPRDAPWYKAFIKELITFPGGRYDDQADAFSYAGQLMNEISGPRPPKSQRKKSWRDNLAKYRAGGAKGNWRTA